MANIYATIKPMADVDGIPCYKLRDPYNAVILGEYFGKGCVVVAIGESEQANAEAMDEIIKSRYERAKKTLAKAECD